jgi:hypothetical protein
MAKYVLLLSGADVDKRGVPELYERWSNWLRSVRADGRTVDSYGLRDQGGVRLTVRGGQVVEGPFMETKEAVGGIVFFDAETLDEAIAIARTCPVIELQNASVEVRMVQLASMSSPAAS